MASSIQLTDELTTITYPGGEFKIDLVEATIKAGEIAQMCKGCEDYRHIDMFGDYLKSISGGVELKRSLVDQLYTKVHITYAEIKKKAFSDAGLLSFTESTRSN